ncbi:MAG TPA: hypothetical protein VJT82_02265 [Pyrinomonadaceae bacterium]|nr:hypothetical protein [Pyrinomonadaceae bacterium]
MNSPVSGGRARQVACTIFALLLLPGALQTGVAQTAPDPSSNAQTQTTPESGFRLERKPVEGGAELLTIFGSLDGLPRGAADAKDSDVPLVSILRDTLGDAATENDRLRYVWMHTYTRPSAGQRAASAVPFLYTRVGSKKRAGGDVPPPVVDLAGTEHDVWQKVFLNALQTILLDSYGFGVKATTRAYRRNADDYRKAHIIRALAVLALYQAESGTGSVFAPHELKEIQARLMLTQKTFGGIIDDIYLERVYEKQTAQWLDTRGHNWELLRQRAEAEGLYFEPLDMPGGETTHALLWIARSDLQANRERRYDNRFLNLDNPWRDARLRRWRGYTETRYFDAENRRVAAGTAGARVVELIPLALYGLDHPKIPIMLVDFRDGLNPKKREMSQRVLQDVTRTALSLSRFDLAYFLGRTVYEYVTDRRGMDVNQPSRLRAYSQLKLLLALNATLDPELRDELTGKLERVSLNPLENDLHAEAQLAREQYAALLDYAGRPKGLSAKLDRDRRAEMTPFVHSRTTQVLFRLANTLSFGLYTHREDAAPDKQVATLDIERRLTHHRQFLREVAKSSSQVEVQWDIADVRRSLQFINEHGERADSKTSKAIAQIFARTGDEETRKLCLGSLYRINNEAAKNSLVRIYRDAASDERWRAMSAEYLLKATREEQRISANDAKFIATMAGQ